MQNGVKQKKKQTAGGKGESQAASNTAQCVALVDATDPITGTWRIAADTLPKMQKQTGRGFQPWGEKISSFAINSFHSSSAHHSQHMTLIINLENTSRLKFPAVQSIETFKEESSSILQHKSPAATTWYWHIHSPSARTGRGKDSMKLSQIFIQ